MALMQLTTDAPRAAQAVRSPWVGRVIVLSWFTIVYNLVEGVVSMGFGVQESSIALFGFGADSFIEMFSAIVVLWRFRSESGAAGSDVAALDVSVERERAATKTIGWLFVLLAAFTALGAIFQLATLRHPDTTLPGVIIALISLSFMFALWFAKKRAAVALASRTVAADAACSLACIKLSGVLLAGAVVFAVAPALWWADAVAALVIAVLIAREGKETIEHANSKDFSCGGCGCAHGD